MKAKGEDPRPGGASGPLLTWVGVAAGVLLLCLGAGVWLAHLSRGGSEPARLVGQMGHSVEIEIPPAPPRTSGPRVVTPVPPPSPAPAPAPAPAPVPVPTARIPSASSTQGARPSRATSEPVRAGHLSERDAGRTRAARPVASASSSAAPPSTPPEARLPEAAPAPAAAPVREDPRPAPVEARAAPVTQEPQPANNAATPAPAARAGVEAPARRRGRGVDDRRIRDALGTVRPM